MPAQNAEEEPTGTLGVTSFEQDFPASRSGSDSINEDLRMPRDTEKSPDRSGPMPIARQYWAKIEQGMQARPWTFILGAAGIGFFCGWRVAVSERFGYS